jgi:hypothetical protein
MPEAEPISSAISAMGSTLGPEVLTACKALFDSEQSALAARVPVAVRDCAYGPDPRNRLDLYGAMAGEHRPVLLFVHGGGFVMGDKGGDAWPNAAVGRMAAEAGFVGAVMNYRLALGPQAAKTSARPSAGCVPMRPVMAATRIGSSCAGHRPAPCIWLAI